MNGPMIDENVLRIILEEGKDNEIVKVDVLSIEKETINFKVIYRYEHKDSTCYFHIHTSEYKNYLRKIRCDQREAKLKRILE